VAGDGLARELAGSGLRPEDRYPLVDLGTLPPRAGALVARFEEAGLTLRLQSITSDIGIASIRASVRDGNGGQHTGFGTHPDVEVALIRAITECAQARALDPGIGAEPALSTVDIPATGEKVSNLPSYPSDDVVTDIWLMLDRLASRGIDRVVVVDVSPPEIPVHVVRVVAPGLESWAIDRSKLGRRASAAWDRAVAEVSG
jgi:ribosomal protein S12 methylthiotransferase accessory factor